VPVHGPLTVPFLVLSNVWNMHQVHLIKFLILAASDLFLQSQLMMIFCLPHTLSLPPIFAVDFVCWCIVIWQRGFWMQGLCEICIRCIRLSSWK
jgi:hypothetical protein